jgi:hypothetical protein
LTPLYSSEFLTIHQFYGSKKTRPRPPSLPDETTDPFVTLGRTIHEDGIKLKRNPSWHIEESPFTTLWKPSDAFRQTKAHPHAKVSKNRSWFRVQAGHWRAEHDLRDPSCRKSQLSPDPA